MKLQESEFVEAMGRFLGSTGMPPMAGRMWAWLLICEPPTQTAAELAEALEASRGAISGTARLLETSGFIRRTSRRGDRREYFSAPPGTFRALIAGAGTSYRRFREVTELGLAALADEPDRSRERIEEVHDFTRFVEAEIPALLDRFIEERARASDSTYQRKTLA
jgi:DNA-binding transcriptional regulator GbsR (MarR family)